MTNKRSIRLLPLGLIACLTLGSASAAQDAESPSPQQARATAVCLDCHDDPGLALALTPCAVDLEAVVSAMRVACTDCHGSNSQHWEEDPESYPMVNPAKLAATAEAELCGRCHMDSHQQNMLERNVHTANEISCSGCHSIHAGRTDMALLHDQEPELCYSCHQDVEGEFARSYRHPINDGIVQCSECHRQLDETRVDLSLNGTDVCSSCHPEFQGPYPYQHAATLDYSTQEGGCLACHAAHGSDHPRMLLQPYESPHFQLCTQCHAIPPGHNSNAQHGTQWMGQDCNLCHSDIHGSYTNRFFLSETLAADGCLNAGCHGR